MSRDRLATLAVRDPSGARVGALLREAEELERCTARRELLVILLGVLAVPLWIATLWPGLLSVGDRRFIDIGFGVLLAVTLVAWLAERRSARRVRRLVESDDLEEDAPVDGRSRSPERH